MKIAIVLNTSWNIYNFRMGFVKALQAEGVEVHTIAPIDDYTKYLQEAGCIHHPLRMDSRGSNPVKDVALIFELMSIYRKVRPDVILHYTIKPNVYGSFAAAFLGIPAINNVCGLGTVFLKKNLVSAIAIALYKISFRFPEKVFFQNQEDLHLFINRNLIKKEKADLLPGSGIDLKKFTPMSFRRNHRFTFIMISRLIIDKGVLEYIEAIKILKDKGIQARFQILGAKDPEHKRGIKSAMIDEWINEGLIEYLGTTKNVQPYINGADCVVLPSYREGTPRALLEAASCGKPMIATDVPGCHQVVKDNYNGFLCNLKDAEDLAAKMENMLSLDNEQLKQFGINGRALVEREYDENIVIDKYITSINTLRVAS
ncbi:MAG: glycosyltransferase family 4 protein [Bacteroidetes bacterium]|nr:glycosyltransferase family 4 protein [Bacteroidota bacterium]